MKIVNGTIVRDTNDHNLATVNASADAESGQDSFFSKSIVICNTPVRYVYLACAMLVSFMINGIAGVFFVGLALGIAYLYGQRMRQDGNESSGEMFGMSKMTTRPSSSRGGANIKGISDLPKPVSR